MRLLMKHGPTSGHQLEPRRHRGSRGPQSGQCTCVKLAHSSNKQFSTAAPLATGSVPAPTLNLRNSNRVPPLLSQPRQPEPPLTTGTPAGVVCGEFLSKYCTWGIGGPATYLARVRDVSSLLDILRWARRRSIRVWVVGRGSNTLFDDRGFDGLVIVNEIASVQDLGGGVFRVGSGHKFNSFGLWTARRGYSGLEFAVGIPATVGGAAYMNAGADGQETAAVLVGAEVLTHSGRLRTLDVSEGSHLGGMFGYRTSPFQESPDSIITSLTFQLQQDPQAAARAEDNWRRRLATQPLHARTAGCVFRNPAGHEVSAGQLIDDLGLKGAGVGGARVSGQHANFLINEDGSGSTEMKQLIDLVKHRVASETGIMLLEEICYAPYRAPSDKSAGQQ